MVAAALDLLSAVGGSEERAAHTWSRAGVFGAALGPAVGGVLTQLLGWESIFLVQAPLALAPLAALGALARPTALRRAYPDDRTCRRTWRSSSALRRSAPHCSCSSSSSSTAGTSIRRRPVRVATVLPVAAIAVSQRHATCRVEPAARDHRAPADRRRPRRARCPPPRRLGVDDPPQALVGAGLGLTIAALTGEALEGRSPQAVHGGWTIASRHGGVVLGLLMLTPLFSAQLDRNETEAKRAGAAILLDSRVPPLDKLRVAEDVLRAIDQADGRLPDVHSAFHGRFDGPARPEYRRVASRLQDQLERAVTSAFGWPFLLASALALLGLAAVVIGGGGRRRCDARLAPLGAVVALGAALIASYLALGGRSYRPAAVADPCADRPGGRRTASPRRSSRSRLSTADGAACTLHVPREDLVLALASGDDLSRFAREHHLSQDDAERAIRDGLVRAVDDAERADAIGGGLAGTLRSVARHLPIGLVLDVLHGASSLLLIPG